jgi:hypothetical protein
MRGRKSSMNGYQSLILNFITKLPLWKINHVPSMSKACSVAFWVMTPCSLTGGSSHSRRTCCLYHQGRRDSQVFCAEVDTRFLWNGGNLLPDYMILWHIRSKQELWSHKSWLLVGSGPETETEEWCFLPSLCRWLHMQQWNTSWYCTATIALQQRNNVFWVVCATIL